MKNTADILIETQKLSWRKNRLIGLLPEKFSHPTGIQLEITSMCNHRCKYCFSRSEGYGHGAGENKELSDSQWMHIVDEIVESNVFSVIIAGGEPFIRTPLVNNMVKKFHESDVRTGIISNGFNLSRKKIKRLKEYADAIQWVQISLDGWMRDVHDRIRGRKGAFDRATEAIVDLRESGIPVKMAVTLMPENRCEVDAFFELGLLLGVNCLHIGEGFIIGPAADSMIVTQEQKDMTLHKLERLKEAYQPYFDTMIAMDPCQTVQVYSRYRINNAYIIKPNGSLRLDSAVPVTFGRYGKPGDLKQIWQTGGLAQAHDNKAVRQTVSTITREQSFANVSEVESMQQGHII